MSASPSTTGRTFENRDEVLMRQVHPMYYSGGRVADSAFKPTTTDFGRLSVNYGMTGEEAWKSRRAQGKPSAGTWGFDVGTCHSNRLPVADDSSTFPKHALVDLREEDASFSEKSLKKKAIILATRARNRGPDYLPPPETRPEAGTATGTTH